MDGITSRNNQFVLFSQEQQTSSRLEKLLADYGQLLRADLLQAPETVPSALHSARLVFVDFNLDPDSDAGRQRLAAARHLCGYMASHFPQVPRVALTRYDAGALTVEALRAGASDCIDLGNENDAALTLMRLMDTPQTKHADSASPGHSILILGARQGMGATTLATHLAELGQIRLRKAFGGKEHKGSQPASRRQEQRETRTCLLDLGVPTRDAQLYLGVPGGFHFLDAVRSLHRLDDTLLDSALPHDSHGLSVLSFPPRRDDMRDVTQSDALALFDRLGEFFGLMIVDLGGMDNIPFIASLINKADQTWLITDQSLGGLLSLAENIQLLQAQQVDRQDLRLVVNRYDSRYGLSAQQIADKFELPLLGTLPDCTSSLWRQLSQGNRPARTSTRHPYVQAANRLLEQALADRAPQEPGSRLHSLWRALRVTRRAY